MKKETHFSIAIFAVIVLLTSLTLRWSSTLQDFNARFAEHENTEVSDPAESGTLLFRDNDSLYWIAYAREMAAARQWRIRHTHLDNPPDGRPMHWSQSMAWLLVALGFLRNLFTQEGMHHAIENAAIWAGPLQHIAFIAGTGWFLFKRLGLLPALLWMANLLFMPPVEWAFHSFRPDHHGLHLISVTTSLLCLVLGGMGWVSNTSPTEAKKSAWINRLDLPTAGTAKGYFIASGVFGGMGIWTGATIQLFGIGLLAGGAVLLVLFVPENFVTQEQEITYQPSLWRTWALAGTLVSFFFYLLEYAPRFPGMRLEVNHPLYLLAWLCVGEFLTRFCTHRIAGNISVKVMIQLAFLLLAASLLPLLLLFGPASWHAFRDPYMQRLHDYIIEFGPFFRATQEQPVTALVKNFGVLPIFLLIPPLLAGKKQTTLYEWAMLWMALLASFTYLALTLLQVRWACSLAVTLLLLALMVFMVLWRNHNTQQRKPAWMLGLVLLLCLQPLLFLAVQVQRIKQMSQPTQFDRNLTQRVLDRQVARRLATLNTQSLYRVISMPGMAARLHYYGNIPSLTSLYWENTEGLRDATHFFAATNFEEASKIAQQRGITHVIIQRNTQVAYQFHHIKTGRLSTLGAQATFAGQMILHPEELPEWIKRDHDLEQYLQPGFLLLGEHPLASDYMVFVTR